MVIHSHMNITNFVTAFTVFRANWSWWTQLYFTLFVFGDTPIPRYPSTDTARLLQVLEWAMGMGKALRWLEAGFLSLPRDGMNFGGGELNQYHSTYTPLFIIRPLF